MDNAADNNEKKASPDETLFSNSFSTKERKNLLMYIVIAIVLMELAMTVGAVVYSITHAERMASGMMRFNFPWLGYTIMATLIPVLTMLIFHLVGMGLTRRSSDGAPLPESRAATFFALVRGAPTIILFAGFVILGAALYYLDGVMALLLKLGDSFQTVAIWLIGALGLTLCVNAVAKAVFMYKSKQMEAEYAFRREVLERTGTILLDARLAPTTDLRQIPAPLDVKALEHHDKPNGSDGEPPLLEQPAGGEEQDAEE